MIRCLVGFTLISGFAFIAGMGAVHYNTFPYPQIRAVKNHFSPPPAPQTDERITNPSGYQKVSLEDIRKNQKTGVFVTYGQSNSVNFGQIGYDVKNNVAMYYNDNFYAYQDPALGGSGKTGSVWGMVGDKLIENGQFDSIIFAVTGYGGTTIGQLRQPELYDFMKKQLLSLKEKTGKIDGILFHQGESNHQKWSGENYYHNFVSFFEKLRKDGIQAPIYLSQASYCGDGGIDKNVTDAQNRLIQEFDNILRGPNTDLLTDDRYRLPDQCHFSMFGYEKFSDMWVQALKNPSGE